jgi:hypothetical protein
LLRSYFDERCCGNDLVDATALHVVKMGRYHEFIRNKIGPPQAIDVVDEALVVVGDS